MQSRIAVVMPCGPGASQALDTLESVEHYLGPDCPVVIVDDCTTDGTYEGILEVARPTWVVLRNHRTRGIAGLIQSLADGFRAVLESTDAHVVLRLDQDALVINPGLPEAVSKYLESHEEVGIFGVYREDYNRPRSFDVHTTLMNSELHGLRRVVRGRPFWADTLAAAERRGYERGDNVFGGAYLVTRACLEALCEIGALRIPEHHRSGIQEDVYFSLAAVAAGFQMGHFAVPEWPLCLEWRGLPHPARELWSAGYAVVHSVDKGPNTGPDDNEGQTAREVFRAIRHSA